MSEAIEKIRQKHPHAKLEALTGDLSKVDAVMQATSRFPQVDILIKVAIHFAPPATRCTLERCKSKGDRFENRSIRTAFSLFETMASVASENDATTYRFRWRQVDSHFTRLPDQENR